MRKPVEKLGEYIYTAKMLGNLEQNIQNDENEYYYIDESGLN